MIEVFNLKNLKVHWIGFFLLMFIVQSAPVFGQFFFMQQNSLVGKPAPDFTLATVSGEKKNMTEFRNGDSAIIFFWATWCPHCREQLKSLNDRADELKEKGIKLILVDLGEGQNQVRSFIEKQKINFEVFLDEDSSLTNIYDLIGVPTFFLVDREGIVQAVEHDIRDDYEEILALKER